MSNWIDWQGGECPVDGVTVVEVRAVGDERAIGRADDFSWDTSRRDLSRITAYRVLPTFADLAEKDAEIERLRADEQECAALRQRMSDILNRTANALRGEPPPLALHGWSDLPERVDRLRAELAVAREALTGLVDVIDAAGLHNLIHGVQLGPTVWYVKASDAMNSARAAIKGVDMPASNGC